VQGCAAKLQRLEEWTILDYHVKINSSDVITVFNGETCKPTTELTNQSHAAVVKRITTVEIERSDVAEFGKQRMCFCLVSLVLEQKFVCKPEVFDFPQV